MVYNVCAQINKYCFETDASLNQCTDIKYYDDIIIVEQEFNIIFFWILGRIFSQQDVKTT